MLADKGMLEPPMEVPRLFRFGLDYPVWNGDETKPECIRTASIKCDDSNHELVVTGEDSN